jgi:hypothetical protein
MVQGDTPRGVPQGTVLAHTFCILYINDTPKTQGDYLVLFAYDTCIYNIDRELDYFLRKFQCDLTSIESWCEGWNIKINDVKFKAIYFSYWQKEVDAYLILKGRHISFQTTWNISV